jgi:hypothetical protein
MAKQTVTLLIRSMNAKGKRAWVEVKWQEKL